MRFFGILFLLLIIGCAGFERLVVREKVWIYKHLELGTFLYCDADQKNPRDYMFIGTATINSKKAERCSLAQK